ncbi:MAG: bifunctional UDP-sugar hydrolase/5'-nucleotidase [Planctomycetota bacterium]|nr:bifunctional UDP-sugar hydrolase/5'-nucleotidase [Planctomycetota bacterium]
MKHRLLFSLLVVLLACSVAVAAEPTPAPQAAAAAAGESVDLTFLHINDPHGHIMPYKTEEGKDVGGYARLATLIEGARQATKAARVFLVHAGDEFSRGDALTESTHGAANIAIMNQLGFDVWTLGNGEFYTGWPVLKARIGEFKGATLAANVVVRDAGEPVGKPYVILQAGPVKVAFFGLCFLSPMDDSFWTFRVADATETAAKLVPELRKQADVIVAVTHHGSWLDKRIGSAVDGIDLMIGAHTHQVLEKGDHAKGPSGRDVLVVQAGDNLQYLGRVDLRVVKTDGGWRVSQSSAMLVPIDDKVKADPAVAALIAKLSPPAVKTPLPTPKKPAAAAASK